MTPSEYEHLVAQHFAEKGFVVRVSPQTGDYGVDVFAEQGNIKIAIQAKMYGATSRSINRQTVMELYGAKDYFGCTDAVIATDGRMLEDALEVAQRLKIEVLHLPALPASGGESAERVPDAFSRIWEEHVVPLEGRTLTRRNGKTNTIVKVDWAGVERITSNGRRQRIEIEVFRRAINHLLEHGTITRSMINDECKERASSGVVLILSNVDLFELTERPIGLRLRQD